MVKRKASRKKVPPSQILSLSGSAFAASCRSAWPEEGLYPRVFGWFPLLQTSGLVLEDRKLLWCELTLRAGLEFMPSNPHLRPIAFAAFFCLLLWGPHLVNCRLQLAASCQVLFELPSTLQKCLDRQAYGEAVEAYCCLVGKKSEATQVIDVTSSKLVGLRTYSDQSLLLKLDRFIHSLVVALSESEQSWAHESKVFPVQIPTYCLNVQRS